ncbi:MAG: tyrosine-type recombinase/integrase [Dehalococcoidia bacterium]|nr:tyrosine-type recombinase/integrase [Dehalococcoidia bacterium]
MASGSIKRTKAGTWTCVFDLGVDPLTGKRKQQRMTFRTKVEAEKAVRDQLTRVENGGYVKPERLTVSQFLDQWMDSYARPNLSPSTVQGYAGIVNFHLKPGLGAIPLQRLEPLHISKFYTRLNDGTRTAKTCRNVHNVLAKALSQAVRLRLIPFNPAKAVDAPRYQRRQMKLLTEAQVSLFEEAIEKSPFKDAFIISMYSGLRRAEVLGLRWCDVDLLLGQIKVSQTLLRIPGRGIIFKPPKSVSSRRPVDLGPTPCIALRKRKEQRTAELAAAGALLDEDSLIFSYIDGRPYEPTGFSHSFKEIARQIGCENMRLHDLRHYHGSALIKDGVNIKVVQERLGHADVATTLNFYAHTFPGQDREAALKFEESMKKRRDYSVTISSKTDSANQKIEAAPL